MAFSSDLELDRFGSDVLPSVHFQQHNQQPQRQQRAVVRTNDLGRRESCRNYGGLPSGRHGCVLGGTYIRAHKILITGILGTVLLLVGCGWLAWTIADLENRGYSAAVAVSVIVQVILAGLMALGGTSLILMAIVLKCLARKRARELARESQPNVYFNLGWVGFGRSSVQNDYAIPQPRESAPLGMIRNNLSPMTNSQLHHQDTVTGESEDIIFIWNTRRGNSVRSNAPHQSSQELTSTALVEPYAVGNLAFLNPAFRHSQQTVYEEMQPSGRRNEDNRCGFGRGTRAFETGGLGRSAEGDHADGRGNQEARDAWIGKTSF